MSMTNNPLLTTNCSSVGCCKNLSIEEIGAPCGSNNEFGNDFFDQLVKIIAVHLHEQRKRNENYY